MSKNNSPNGSDADVWDDSLLVVAYDKSLKLFEKEKQSRKRPISIEINTQNKNEKLLFQKEKNEEDVNKDHVKTVFKVGEYVRAVYDDGFDYEAKILSVDDETQTCLLKYIGYGNEQHVKMNDLSDTWGREARREQFVKSKQEGKKTNKKKYNKTKSDFPVGSFRPAQPPPMPPMPPGLSDCFDDSEHLSTMLMSWYMSGYYTGFYQGQKSAQQHNTKT